MKPDDFLPVNLKSENVLGDQSADAAYYADLIIE
jgi:hypothetical protein